MFQTLKMLPAHILFLEGEMVGILFFGIAGMAWLLVPFWELRQKSHSKFNMMKIFGLVAVLFIIIMTVVGYLV
jgi:hypothetical protein